jgi:hypothetical protein
MMMSKKGQGLSLNVIIVAALALIVLVVLVVVFTGRIGIFDRDLGKAADTELVKLSIKYGDCEPSSAEEQRFKDSHSQADSSIGQAEARDLFNVVIRDCKTLNTIESCGSSGQCIWNP